MNTKTQFILFLILCLSMSVMAQIGTPGDDGPGGPGDAAPIDALISLGLGAGAIYGAVRKLKR